jgi:hypothetical protein
VIGIGIDRTVGVFFKTSFGLLAATLTPFHGLHQSIFLEQISA